MGLLRARRERPRRSGAAKQRDELGAGSLSDASRAFDRRIAHLKYGRRLLRCGISIRPMSELGSIASK